MSQDDSYDFLQALYQSVMENTNLDLGLPKKESPCEANYDKLWPRLPAVWVQGACWMSNCWIWHSESIRQNPSSQARYFFSLFYSTSLCNYREVIDKLLLLVIPKYMYKVVCPFLEQCENCDLDLIAWLYAIGMSTVSWMSFDPLLCVSVTSVSDQHWYMCVWSCNLKYTGQSIADTTQVCVVHTHTHTHTHTMLSRHIHVPFISL